MPRHAPSWRCYVACPMSRKWARRHICDGIEPPPVVPSANHPHQGVRMAYKRCQVRRKSPNAARLRDGGEHHPTLELRLRSPETHYMTSGRISGRSACKLRLDRFPEKAVGFSASDIVSATEDELWTATEQTVPENTTILSIGTYCLPVLTVKSRIIAANLTTYFLCHS